MVSITENEGVSSPFPNSPQLSSPSHRNKLTQCFEDILKVSSEMMVQQQLRTVQLDSSVVNGFSQIQQRLLGEKIHMFHAILDDLETTLYKSKTYVQSVYDYGLEREKQKQKEREEVRRRQEEEEARKQAELKKQLEEEKKAQAEELQNQEYNQSRIGTANSDMDTKMNFSMDPTNGLLADFGGNEPDLNIPGVLTAKERPADSNQSPIELNSDLRTGHQTPQTAQSSLNQGSNHKQTPQQQKKQHLQQARNDSNDLGMNMSMLSGLENGNLDMGDFNTRMNEVKDKDNVNSNNIMPLADNFAGSSGNNNDTPTLNDAPANNLGDNEDDYLTLNDFNDFNIDWNTTGNPGDLDLNDFNI